MYPAPFIIDNVMFNLEGPSNDIMESIHINAYNANEHLIYNPNKQDTTYANSDVFYIGIALENWAEPEVINGAGYIVVTYAGQAIFYFLLHFLNFLLILKPQSHIWDKLVQIEIPYLQRLKFFQSYHI